jgi:transposase
MRSFPASRSNAPRARGCCTDKILSPIGINKHADETGFREGVGRSRVWLWTVVTTHAVVFMIHAPRNAEAAKELLGDWFGVLVTDRHGAYHLWPNCRLQFCWAHIKRDLQTIVERGGESARIGEGMLDEVPQMFTWWHRVRTARSHARRSAPTCAR